MKIEAYQVFGSADSRDCDIVVFIDKIPNVAQSKEMICHAEAQLQENYSKKVNVNLAKLDNGVIVDVFKGTPDEVNNSLLRTYGLHQQAYPLFVHRAVERDPGLKSLRSMRSILSFISRTSWRMSVKQALRGSAADKHALLKEVRFDLIRDLKFKNADLADFWKMLAFQMGQSYLLNTGIEAYTKQEIAAHLPELECFLLRSGGDPSALNEMKTLWLGSFDPSLIPQFESLRE